MSFIAPPLYLLLTCSVSCYVWNRAMAQQEYLSSFFQVIHQNFGGRGDQAPQEITTVTLLDFSCEKLSASLCYPLSLLSIRPGE